MTLNAGPPDRADQMFRKRPAGPVTCCAWLVRSSELRKYPFGCFAVRPVDAAGSPRKVPEHSHRLQPLFRLYVKCGAGIRASVVAPERKAMQLLERFAAGEKSGAWAAGDWRSAYGLRDRGLLTARRGGGDAQVEATEVGRFYLWHGHHPDDPVLANIGARAGSADSSASANSPLRRGSTS